MGRRPGESPLKQRARSERSEGQGSAVTYGGSSEKHTPPLAPFSFGLPALAPATHGRRAEPAFATPLSRSRLASACKAARGIPVGSQGRSQRRLASARVPIIVVPSLSQSLLREPSLFESSRSLGLQCAMCNPHSKCSRRRSGERAGVGCKGLFKRGGRGMRPTFL